MALLLAIVRCLIPITSMSVRIQMVLFHLFVGCVRLKVLDCVRLLSMVVVLVLLLILVAINWWKSSLDRIQYRVAYISMPPIKMGLRVHFSFSSLILPVVSSLVDLDQFNVLVRFRIKHNLDVCALELVGRRVSMFNLLKTFRLLMVNWL